MKSPQERKARCDALIKNLKSNELPLATLEALMHIAIEENDNVERHILLCAAERAGELYFQALLAVLDRS